MEIALYLMNIKGFSMPDKNTIKEPIVFKELDPNDPMVIKMNWIGSLVPEEVARQEAEYKERMEIAERAFGEAVRSIVIKY
jgi:hypothetical protein